MIYRHYGNGKLYYSIGFATRFSKDFPATRVEQIALARYTEAEKEEEKNPIAVLRIHDEKTGSIYYAYDTELIDGLHTFYKDLDGNHWLRPSEMFSDMIDGRPRFEKVSGEELFETISGLFNK